MRNTFRTRTTTQAPTSDGLTAHPGTTAWAARGLAALVAFVAIALTVMGGASAANAAAPAGSHGTIATHSTGTAIHPMTGGWGYVSQGNLRPNPNQDNTPIATIYNQWVNILCWIDGGYNGFGSYRWFKAQYYSLTGYLSSGVVSSQPSVGHC